MPVLQRDCGFSVAANSCCLGFSLILVCASVSLVSAMVLHRLDPKKTDKEQWEKNQKKKTRKLKQQQGPNPTKADLAKPSLALGAQIGDAMNVDTREQARIEPTKKTKTCASFKQNTC